MNYEVRWKLFSNLWVNCVREVTNPGKLSAARTRRWLRTTPQNKTHFRKAIRKWIPSNFDLVQSIAVVYLNRDYEPPPWGRARLGGSESIVVKDAVLLLDVRWGIQLYIEVLNILCVPGFA
ncbi:hypothetical protein CEXT_488931 [Caerostris extrusa]|uniref:Uncharacterized protein n=1 Tax=Caerostris extrusa TaxID=172846 RepID=A0AAV4SAZ4_CAEEX|nr:hypothetical protein CEXT_488931 [Caerostris extrusa]